MEVPPGPAATEPPTDRQAFAQEEVEEVFEPLEVVLGGALGTVY